MTESGARARLVFGSFDLPDDPSAHRLLDRFHAAGGRALDLANVYRDGEGERAIGSWLRARSPDGVVLYVKGCHPPFCSPDLVADEIDQARDRLGVDRIDVFLLHRDDPALPVEQFADALLEQVDVGRITKFGVSNWTLDRLAALRAYLTRVGQEHLVAFSNHFSLAEMVSAPWPGCLALDRRDLRELAPSGVTMLAWSSLAVGYFAGRDSPSWDSPANRGRRERAGLLAGELGTSATAVALAYVLHQPELVLPVVGTRSEAHLDEAFSATEIQLTPEQLTWLESGRS
jgi:aryl-alcohol dehydrogenase-like predicted oxidoreductase